MSHAFKPFPIPISITSQCHHSSPVLHGPCSETGLSLMPVFSAPASSVCLSRSTTSGAWWIASILSSHAGKGQFCALLCQTTHHAPSPQELLPGGSIFGVAFTTCMCSTQFVLTFIPSCQCRFQAIATVPTYAAFLRHLGLLCHFQAYPQSLLLLWDQMGSHHGQHSPPCRLDLSWTQLVNGATTPTVVAILDK